MSLTVKCPLCKVALEADDHAIGSIVYCPACAQAITIAAPATVRLAEKKPRGTHSAIRIFLMLIGVILMLGGLGGSLGLLIAGGILTLLAAFAK